MALARYRRPESEVPPSWSVAAIRRPRATGLPGSWSGAPQPDQVHGHEAENGLVVLVEQLCPGADQAPVWLGPGPACLQDRGPQPQRVARAHGGGPAQFVHARRSQAGNPGHVMVNDQAHGEAGGVPAAGDQAAERAIGSEPGVSVDWLGIEALSEGDDVRLAHAHAHVTVLIHRADCIVLEVAVFGANREVAAAQRARRAVLPDGVSHSRPGLPGFTPATLSGSRHLRQGCKDPGADQSIHGRDDPAVNVARGTQAPSRRRPGAAGAAWRLRSGRACFSGRPPDALSTWLDSQPRPPRRTAGMGESFRVRW